MVSTADGPDAARSKTAHDSWKRVFGLELFKLDWYWKYGLYKLFGLTLPKLWDQREYWCRRGEAYMQEILTSGYLEREAFFQDLLISELKSMEWDSIFEAGCGFGWNIKKIKEAWPRLRVGGLDFSVTQLANSRAYLKGMDVEVANGDICRMPYRNDAFDVGFSVGVFMNLHSKKIEAAIREMIRVCGKYIIHIEWDADHTTPALREKRAFKRNIVSHDYRDLYKSFGSKIVTFLTHEDFGQAYRFHVDRIRTPVTRWEGFEGPEKYILAVIEV